MFICVSLCDISHVPGRPKRSLQSPGAIWHLFDRVLARNCMLPFDITLLFWSTFNILSLPFRSPTNSWLGKRPPKARREYRLKPQQCQRPGAVNVSEVLIRENSPNIRLYKVSLSGCWGRTYGHLLNYSEYSEFVDIRNISPHAHYLLIMYLQVFQVVFRLTKTVCCHASSAPALSMCQCEAVETTQVAQDPLASATLRAQGTIGTLSRISCVYKRNKYR